MEAATLLNFLKQRGYITAVQMEDLMEEHRRTGKPMVTVLEDSSVISQADLYQAIATEIGTEVIDLSACEFTPELMGRIPPQTARVQGALPVYFAEDTLYVTLVNPLDAQAGDSIRFATGFNVQIYVAPPDAVRS